MEGSMQSRDMIQVHGNMTCTTSAQQHVPQFHSSTYHKCTAARTTGAQQHTSPLQVSQTLFVQLAIVEHAHTRAHILFERSDWPWYVRHRYILEVINGSNGGSRSCAHPQASYTYTCTRPANTKASHTNTRPANPRSRSRTKEIVCDLSFRSTACL